MHDSKPSRRSRSSCTWIDIFILIFINSFFLDIYCLLATIISDNDKSSLTTSVNKFSSECWLCKGNSGLDISHQIEEEEVFRRLQAYGTLPVEIHLSHGDNLFPLCSNCRRGYDKTFPDWILVPDASTRDVYWTRERKLWIPLWSQVWLAGNNNRIIPHSTSSNPSHHQ